MDETSYGDWLIAQGLVALSQEPKVKPGVVPNTVKTDMQNHSNVSKVTVPEDGKANNTQKQGGAQVDNVAKAQVNPEVKSPDKGNVPVPEPAKNEPDIHKINISVPDKETTPVAWPQPILDWPQPTGAVASESLDSLFDQLQSYMGAMDIEECENKIEQL